MYNNLDIYEIIGFVASVIIAFSLTMSSIVKLRWYNLAGASIFSVYGFLIGSMPVALLNLFISLANIYYLRLIYAKKEHLKILLIKPDSSYLDFFLEYHHHDIVKYFPDFPDKIPFLKKEEEKPFALLILRDAAVAGVVLGKKTSPDELFIFLDYVIPPYRDLKPAKFLYLDNPGFFKEHNIKTVLTSASNSYFIKFLETMGFKKQVNQSDGKEYMIKKIK